MRTFKQFYGHIMAIIIKEFSELRRDRASLLMILAIPLINLCILGFSVNADPKYVRTAIIDYDSTPMSRTLMVGMANTGYFSLEKIESERAADKLFREGKVQIVVIIPANFARDMISEKKPQLLIQTDATDPAATANATQALMTLLNTVFINDIKNIPGLKKYNNQLVDLVLHKMYNPEAITKLNVVPGLAGVVLSIILILMTSLSIIREREKGSIIHIVTSPALPYEIMLGKIIPYFIIGIVQTILILLISIYAMGVPIVGSLVSLSILLSIFIILCLATGIIFSTITKSQLQTMQLASFYFLLSTMLSGFMNPFFGMPAWSQLLGKMLPLTYFLRLVRGIMLKGYTLNDMYPDFISLITLTGIIGILSYLLFKKVIDK